MKINITKQQAVQQLLDDEYAIWTRAGAEALIDFFMQLEMDEGVEITFCKVELRCNWHEYKSALDAARDFGCREFDTLQSDDEKETQALSWLNERTICIEFDGGGDGGVVVCVF